MFEYCTKTKVLKTSRMLYLTVSMKHNEPMLKAITKEISSWKRTLIKSAIKLWEAYTRNEQT